jgi:ABC-2 type transport system ATP-binding protein
VVDAGAARIAIECRDLGRRFGTVAAVAAVTFAVREGEFFALLGPNGAGKTTTLHVLTTVLRPSSGAASVLGFDVVRAAREVRARIGMVFQEPALDERLTAAENLQIHAALYGMPRRAATERLDWALGWAALEEVGARTVRTFSGGMKRRLELARALMHEPRVLFLDEPTLGLDPQGRRHLWDRIAELRLEGLTVFMTTHNLVEAEACDRVAIMDRGQLVALGSPERLKGEIAGRSEADLEEVFFRLTGKQLRDEDATPRARLLAFGRTGGEHTR